MLKPSHSTLLSSWIIHSFILFLAPLRPREQRTLPGIQPLKVVSLQQAILASSGQPPLRCAPRFGDAGGFPPGRVTLQKLPELSFVGQLEFLPAAFSPGVRDQSLGYRTSGAGRAENPEWSSGLGAQTELCGDGNTFKKRPKIWTGVFCLFFNNFICSHPHIGNSHST